MWTTVLNLLLINVILMMVHESGFIEKMDEWVNGRWRFYHLPYPVRCLLCGTWWLSLLYIIIAGPFSLTSIALCLLNAHLTKITQPIFRLLENVALLIIGKINDLLDA